jgi:hypothetical protein
MSHARSPNNDEIRIPTANVSGWYMFFNIRPRLRIVPKKYNFTIKEMVMIANRSSGLQSDEMSIFDICIMILLILNNDITILLSVLYHILFNF